MKLQDIEVGDRVVCKPLCRYSCAKVTRKVKQAIREPYNWQCSGIAIRYSGYSDFWLKAREIIEVIKPTGEVLPFEHYYY